MKIQIPRLALVISALHALVFAQDPAAAQRHAVLGKYCAGCHNPQLQSGGVVLKDLDTANLSANLAVWERVLRQVSSGQMPPPKLPRPDAAASTAFTHDLKTSLDRYAAAHPNPGSSLPHRLNRSEYNNAIRDLLAIDTKPGELFPVDESGDGFDNIAGVLSMSPALLERYISAARAVSKLAVGDLSRKPTQEVYNGGRSGRNVPDTDEIPFGAANGLAIHHYFPLDAEYEIRVAAGRSVDGETPPAGYVVRVPVKAGLQTLSATYLASSTKAEVGLRAFGRRSSGGPGTGMARPQADLDLRMSGVSLKRFQVPGDPPPEINRVVIGGPYNATGRGNTPSREKIFICHPAAPSDEDKCAGEILGNMARRAFRRPVKEADLRPLLRFYNNRRQQGGDFDEGIANALEAMLVSPDFLFRIERNPKGSAPGSVQRVDGYELASRLSFFLWSSIPDEELLKLAETGKLNEPAVVKTQLTRMLADPKSGALIQNFGGQWLFLRTLAGAKPDAEIFPTFDESLRTAFQRETELFLASIFRNGGSVLELLDANYTYLNQRLAEHYGIPNVYGSHFRRVELQDSARGGLLGQGSILTVSSYPNRTSVVLRGKWVLQNLLGTAPPPPPAGTPELPAQAKDGGKLTLREAMEVHRSNAVCASCHSRMDPIGFALENFNAVGQWRSTDAGKPLDTKGKLPDGSEFSGPGELKKLLAERHRDEFVETVTEKLLIYALGRGLEPFDKPVVRSIMKKSSAGNYTMPALISAIVESVPFQMRRTSEK